MFGVKKFFIHLYVVFIIHINVHLHFDF